MFEERSEQLHRVTALLDIALTVFVFLAASWLRRALLDNHPVDFLSLLADDHTHFGRVNVDRDLLAGALDEHLGDAGAGVHAADVVADLLVLD